MYNARAFSAASATSPLAATSISRRAPGPHDVQIDILFCGVCHSDLHQVRDEWHAANPTIYPCVPGHEIVGRVAKVGPSVTRFSVGDRVGVGCLVDSDGTCPECRAGLEQFCPEAVFTYNSPDPHLGGVTYGGYSDTIVVHERFVLRMPSNLDPGAAAPLLCAGITTYSPLRLRGVTTGTRVGVVGLGGLGHMGVKFARAFGAHVTVLTTTARKTDDALRLGAHDVIVSRDATRMQKYAGTFDVILDTVSADHDVDALLQLLRRDAHLTLVGAPERPLSIGAMGLIFGRHNVSGSLIGGLRETQEMLDFCGVHGITSDVEIIPMQQINEAYARMLASDVKYRFSIDMASLRSD